MEFYMHSSMYKSNSFFFQTKMNYIYYTCIMWHKTNLHPLHPAQFNFYIVEQYVFYRITRDRSIQQLTFIFNDTIRGKKRKNNNSNIYNSST